MLVLHSVCPFNDSSDSIISSNADFCHQTLCVWERHHITDGMNDDLKVVMFTVVNSSDFFRL